MFILISFVNTVKRSRHYAKFGLSQLAALDLTTFEIYFLRVPSTLNSTGFTGITQQGKYIYAITQDKVQSSLLRIQKKNLKVDLIKKAVKVKDAHSIICHNDRLYVVSSGTNSIEMFDPKTLDYLGRSWQYPGTASDHDQVHVNSISVVNRELWVSAFGQKVNNSWSLAKNGHLINTKTNARFYRIYHPHSSIGYRNDVYYCESRTGSIFRNNKLFKKVAGSYVRGLDVNSDHIVFGLNSGRLKSKSRGTLNNLKEISQFNFYCGICVLDKLKNSELYFDLSKFSLDIADYAWEIFAVRFVKGIEINDLTNIIGHYKLMPSSTIEKHYVISQLISENHKLRLQLDETIKDRNRFAEELAASQKQVQRHLASLVFIKKFKVFRFYMFLGKILNFLKDIRQSPFSEIKSRGNQDRLTN